MSLRLRIQRGIEYGTGKYRMQSPRRPWRMWIPRAHRWWQDNFPEVLVIAVGLVWAALMISMFIGIALHAIGKLL